MFPSKVNEKCLSESNPRTSQLKINGPEYPTSLNPFIIFFCLCFWIHDSGNRLGWHLRKLRYIRFMKDPGLELTCRFLCVRNYYMSLYLTKTWVSVDKCVTESISIKCKSLQSDWPWDSEDLDVVQIDTKSTGHC